MNAAGPDGWQVTSLVSDWYALNPAVRRLWVYAADEADPGKARELYVVVALAPVCDSDDISPIWLAKCTAWQTQLQELIGRRVHLDCFDAETEVAPCAEQPDRARVCLASVAWRDVVLADARATPSSNRPPAPPLF